MKKTKKWLTVFAALSLTAFLLTAATVVVIDPFFQYHKPLKRFPYLLENQLSQNPGMARNFDYDSVLLGSSMVVAFDTTWFQDKMGLKTCKLPYNAAHPLDQSTIMEQIDRSGNDLKAVILAVDVTTYCTGTDTRAYEIPEYLYDRNPFNDVKYLWNKDVLFNYILRPIATMKEADSFAVIYNKSYNSAYYCSAAALENYHPLPEKNEDEVPEDAYIENLEANLNIHIIPIIENHPDTQFYLFFPPYSILYWHDALQQNNVAARMAEYEKTVEMLSGYPNVKLYFFAGETDIIADLNNYIDYTHYSMEIGESIVESMSKNKTTEIITLDNYKEKIRNLQEFIESYDFGQWGLR